MHQSDSSSLAVQTSPPLWESSKYLVAIWPFWVFWMVSLASLYSPMNIECVYHHASYIYTRITFEGVLGSDLDRDLLWIGIPSISFTSSGIGFILKWNVHFSYWLKSKAHLFFLFICIFQYINDEKLFSLIFHFLLWQIWWSSRHTWCVCASIRCWRFCPPWKY